MPVQTTEKGYIRFPDGAKVQVKKAGGAYFDIGALNSAIQMTLEYTENVVESANAGTLLKQIKQMKANGSFTLINLKPENIEAMGGGLFTQVNTPGTEVLSAAFTNQSHVEFVAGVPKELVAVVTATGVPIRFSAAPVITSITASLSGLLAAGDDYIVVKDPHAASGYSILYNPAGTATVAITETMTIVFGNNTPIARTTLNCGSSTATLTPYAIKFTHTDSANLVRELEIYSANTNSGGFVFSFKGANEDGVEEMPISFTGDVDTSRANGAQLFTYLEDVGAV